MLAVMSESSCDPVVRTVGSEVLKHFPAKLVTQYKYITSMQEGTKINKKSLQIVHVDMIFYHRI